MTTVLQLHHLVNLGKCPTKIGKNQRTPFVIDITNFNVDKYTLLFFCDISVWVYSTLLLISRGQRNSSIPCHVYSVHGVHDLSMPNIFHGPYIYSVPTLPPTTLLYRWPHNCLFKQAIECELPQFTPQSLGFCFPTVFLQPVFCLRTRWH
jgi:hypothetical protein